MPSTRNNLRHLAFFEELATHDENEPEWHAGTAGLVALRLVDHWVEDGKKVTADTFGVKAVRGAIDKIDDGTPIKAILGSVVDGMATGKKPRPRDVTPRLMAYAKALEYDAKWALAADVYECVLGHTHPLEERDLAITAHLQRGFCFRTLGDLDAAMEAYSAAGTIAESVQDMMGILRARIGDAKVAVARGNLPYAERVLDETIEQATIHGVPDARYRALHDRAYVAHQRGQYALSVQFAYDALRGAPDQLARDRVLNDLGGAFYMLGIRSAARDAYLVLAATAQEQYTRWSALISLMGIAADDGMAPLFERYRRELSAATLPPLLEVHFYIHAGVAYHRFREVDSAVGYLERAVVAARRYSLNQLLSEAEQHLEDVTTRVSTAAVVESPAPEELVPIVDLVRDLRERAEATT